MSFWSFGLILNFLTGIYQPCTWTLKPVYLFTIKWWNLSRNSEMSDKYSQRSPIKKADKPHGYQLFVALPTGLEPVTLCLTVRCSANWAMEAFCVSFLKKEIRQRSTLPGGRPPSTIDAIELNFCVRYGNRWFLNAIATGFFFKGTFSSFASQNPRFARPDFFRVLSFCTLKTKQCSLMFSVCSLILLNKPSGY